MSDVLRASGEANGGALWIQRQAGKVPEYVGCVDLDDISVPEGDVTISMCRDGTGKWQTVGRGRGMPGAPTTGFTAWVFPEKSVLDEILDNSCPFVLHAVSKICGRFDDFSSATRSIILNNATRTDAVHGNVVKRADSVEQTLKVGITADYPPSRTREVKVTRQDIAETTNLLDVAFCNEARCAGACGSLQDAGEAGFIAGAAPAGSPTADADIWATVNSGTAWTNSTPGSVHPFAAGLDIVSAVCFDMDKDTKRQLVARETLAGQPAQVAYSDDDWVTRTQVTVGAVIGECAAAQGALFALSKYFIVFATSSGNVYFSQDGGVSWTLLDTASASGGALLNYIHFANTDEGVAVGDTGVIIATTDGGDTWSTIVDPTGGDDVLSVFVFSQYRFVIGTDVGGFWQTWDGGNTFTEQSGYSGYVATNLVVDIKFVNDSVGYMIVNTVAPIGKVYRTRDGGSDWELLTTPTNAGLNALAVINENLAYVVGNAQGGSGFVGKISG
jgi:photosystem II stability/assembly factor-like uncharacterized protein